MDLVIKAANNRQNQVNLKANPESEKSYFLSFSKDVVEFRNLQRFFNENTHIRH